MIPRIRFEEEADAEYREAGRWYESRRTNLGIEFFDAVDTALRQIVEFPHAGTPVPRVSRELRLSQNALKLFPFRVVYLDTPGVLRVLAIAHDRRKPGYWKSRLR